MKISKNKNGKYEEEGGYGESTEKITNVAFKAQKMALKIDAQRCQT